MLQKKNEGILFSAEIRVVGSYTDRLLKAICVPFIAHSVSFIFQYSTSPKNFCELDILCVTVLCQNNSVHCYKNVRETQWTPQQTKTQRL